MKKLLLIIFLFSAPYIYGQRVQGTIKAATQPNEVVLAIRPTAAFTGQMSNIILSVQISTSVGTRPTVTFANLQPSLFATWNQSDEDQGDGFYTWAFNCAAPGGSNTIATNWGTSELDVLRINFGGATGSAQVRICHYLDGGNVNGFALFYIETSLSAVNNGVLSDWGNLFYTPAAVNGSSAPGSIGVPNANYSFGFVGGITLPLQFGSFYAYKSGDNGMLNWNTENQDATLSYFEIERSFDGTTFTKIGRTEPNRNAANAQYLFTDANLFSTYKGTAYYRIKMINRSGNATYSAIRSIRSDGSGFTLNVYPNPAVKEAKITFTLSEAKQVSIQVTDASGKRFTEMNLQAQKGINQKNIDVSALSAGTYIIRIQAGNETQTLSFVKSN